MVCINFMADHWNERYFYIMLCNKSSESTDNIVIKASVRGKPKI